MPFRPRRTATTFSDVIEAVVEFQISGDSVPSPLLKLSNAMWNCVDSGETSNAHSFTGERPDNSLDACNKHAEMDKAAYSSKDVVQHLKEEDDADDDSPSLSPLMSLFASADRRRSRRAATACVGAKQNVDCELPTPTGSSLWNRRHLKQSSIDRSDAAVAISTHGDEVPSACSFAHVKKKPEALTTSQSWSERLRPLLPLLCCCSRGSH